MLSTPIRRRLLPTLLVTAAIPFGAPGVAHASSTHGPPAPPRAPHGARLLAVVKDSARGREVGEAYGATHSSR